VGFLLVVIGRTRNDRMRSILLAFAIIRQQAPGMPGIVRRLRFGWLSVVAAQHINPRLIGLH
jgi:hypothetical protein